MPREILNGISPFSTADNDKESLILIGFIKSIWEVGEGQREAESHKTVDYYYNYDGYCLANKGYLWGVCWMECKVWIKTSFRQHPPTTVCST